MIKKVNPTALYHLAKKDLEQAEKILDLHISQLYKLIVDSSLTQGQKYLLVENIALGVILKKGEGSSKARFDPCEDGLPTDELCIRKYFDEINSLLEDYVVLTFDFKELEEYRLSFSVKVVLR